MMMMMIVQAMARVQHPSLLLQLEVWRVGHTICTTDCFMGSPLCRQNYETCVKAIAGKIHYYCFLPWL